MNIAELDIRKQFAKPIAAALNAGTRPGMRPIRCDWLDD